MGLIHVAELLARSVGAEGPPLDPDRDEARDLLVRELSKQEYTAAKPNLLDRIAQAIHDWLQSLFIPAGGDFSAWIPVLIVLAVVAAVVVAVVVWGVPRRNRASAAGAALFGEDDDRTADELRAAAAGAAARGEWEQAVLDAFRGLARGLAERTVVAATPGMTATGLAHEAERAFPGSVRDLEQAASDFDAVRYLGVVAVAAQYERVSTLDAALSRAVPVALGALGEAVAS